MVRLEKITFRTFIKNIDQIYCLFDENRDRLSPWFWWSNKKETPNKYKFNWLVFKDLVRNEYNKIAHILLNAENVYHESFLVYDNDNTIGGVCGLDNIDTENDKTAEMWGFAFKGKYETIASVKILEKYCINTLHLTSIYSQVEVANMASRRFWHNYGYDTRTFVKQTSSSEFPDSFIYEKTLTR